MPYSLLRRLAGFILPLLIGSALEAQTITNASFEANGDFSVAPGYASGNGGVITGWAMSDPTRTGINTATGPFYHNGIIANGTHVGFLQSTGSTNAYFTNTISGLSAGVTYQVTFRANMRAGYSNPSGTWSLNGGGFVAFTASPAVNADGVFTAPFYTNSATFTATGTTALMVLRNQTATDSTVLLDDFTIAAVGGSIVPTATTLAATGVSNTVAQLNGTVNPNASSTTAWFEWGFSPYTNTSTTTPVAVGSGGAAVTVSNVLSGLTQGLNYHYRMVASNALGVVRGNDVAFGSPAVVLNGAATLTNECHAAFTDVTNPVTATHVPLAITAGDYHNLVLKNDATVAAWGRDDYGQTDIPAGLSNVVAVAGGGFHSLALKSDGKVIAWGAGTNSGTSPNYGQSVVPVGLSNVVALAGGYVHSMALKSDGTVSAWGENLSLQTNVPVGLTNVVAISAGYWHSLALKSDGTLAAWGNATYGLTNIPVGMTSVAAIAAGNYHNLVLKSNGTVAAWGDNTYGKTNIPAGLNNVVAIAGGGDHSLVLKSDGTVVAWGDNTYGQTNIPVGLSNVVAISAGTAYNLAIKSDGKVVCWGYGGYSLATIPAGLTNLTVAVTTGGNFNTNNSPGSYQLTYFLTNGLGGTGTVSRTVVVQDKTAPVITILGSNPLTNSLNVPFVDPGATALDACGGTFAVSTNSTVNVNVPGSYTVTYTSTDSYSNTTNAVRTVVVSPSAPSVTTLAASGVSNTVATLKATVNPNGAATTVWFEWGISSTVTTTNSTASVAVGNGLASVGATNVLSGLTPDVSYFCHVVASNSVGVVRGNDVLFGFPGLVLNGAANLTNECHVAFVDPGAIVPGAPQIIAAGGQHGLVIKRDKTIIAWGNNGSGQTNIPAGLTNVIAIAGGSAHSLAVQSDGTVVGWGANGSGQISIPGGLTNVTAVAASGANSLALRSDGTVAHWGANISGALDVPAGLSNVVRIAAGIIHNLALKSDGTVSIWGYASGAAAAPVGLTNVMAIAAGAVHNLALKTNGTITAWGDNTYGQINVPVGLSNVVAVSGGYSYSLALKSDGTVVAWGDNTYGQTNTSGLSNVVAIAAGDEFGLALKSNGALFAWGRSSEGQTTIPSSLSNLVVSVSGSVGTNSPGTYIINYAVTNSLGGTAAASRTVVVQDRTPPVITILGGTPLTNAFNVPYNDYGAIALDACGGTMAVTTNNLVNVSVPGTYLVTYSATDNYGNSATNTRTVVVMGPPTIWNVTTTNDSGAGSLRQTIAGSVPGDIIQFTNTLSGKSIVLTGGVITLNKTLAIDASALPAGLQLNGNASSCIFNVTAGNVVLTALTITNGRSGGGGGINNSATLIMDRCTVVGNSAASGGGGIASTAVGGRLYLQNCTVAGNQANFGGGVLSSGNSCILSLVHTTISTNLATNGTGGLVFGQGLATFENTIIAGNHHPANANDADMGGSGGTVNLLGNNIIGVAASYSSVTPAGAPNINGDYVGTTANPLNPLLAPLGNYGGPTQTMPPLPGSPAIDFCTNGTSLLIDQRGFNRIVGSFADIGSVEGVFSPILSVSNLTSSNVISFQFPFTNLNGVSFSMLASTNIAAPINTWSNLGAAIEVPSGSGQFQFTDPQATNSGQRFYRVTTP